MILFLFTIVFIAQLIIAAVIIIRLIDLDLAVIALDDRLKARRNIIKYRFYFFKEAAAAYKELIDVTFQNFDKKFQKLRINRLKSAVISIIIFILPCGLRKFMNTVRRSYKIFRYLSRR